MLKCTSRGWKLLCDQNARRAVVYNCTCCTGRNPTRICANALLTCSSREKLPRSIACVNSPLAVGCQPNCCTIASNVPRSSNLSASRMKGPSRRFAVAASIEGNFRRRICSSSRARGELEDGLAVVELCSRCLPRLCPAQGVLATSGPMVNDLEMHLKGFTPDQHPHKKTKRPPCKTDYTTRNLPTCYKICNL